MGNKLHSSFLAVTWLYVKTILLFFSRLFPLRIIAETNLMLPPTQTFPVFKKVFITSAAPLPLRNPI